MIEVDFDVVIIGVGFVGMIVVVYVFCVNLKIVMIECGMLGG